MPLSDDFFASATVHDRPVLLPDGKEHTVYFKEVTAVDVRAYQLAEASEDDAVRAGAAARLIAASVCEPDGTRSMTYEKARTLRPGAASALLSRVLEINNIGRSSAKETSPPGASDGSGMS